jgi:hypothetical protein
LPPSIVHHKGRRSGRAYKTPVGVVRRHDGYAVALTYGPDRGDMPPGVRQILRLIGVADFLHLTKI